MRLIIADSCAGIRDVSLYVCMEVEHKLLPSVQLYTARISRLPSHVRSLDCYAEPKQAKECQDPNFRSD